MGFIKDAKKEIDDFERGSKNKHVTPLLSLLFSSSEDQKKEFNNHMNCQLSAEKRRLEDKMFKLDPTSKKSSEEYFKLSQKIFEIRTRETKYPFKETKSVCYLTTACVDTMGLSDKCFELETLRWFRDKIMQPTGKGKRGISDYKSIAPEIVQSVNETEGVKANKVWKALYNDISRAVGMVITGDFEGAFKHYQQMTQRLKTKYLD